MDFRKMIFIIYPPVEHHSYFIRDVLISSIENHIIK